MSDEVSSKSVDLLGVKGLADSALVVTKGAVDGIGALLSKICLPAAEELGLFFRDKVHAWRSVNATAIASATQAILDQNDESRLAHAHPKIVGKIFELGSWEDDSTVQTYWAGLLASACTETGNDQRNLVFIQILSQLSPSQVKLLNIICQKVSKFTSESGFIMTGSLRVSYIDALEALGTQNLDDADVQLDHLRELGLLRNDGGFQLNNTAVNMTPTALSLHLYTRCQGSNKSPIEYLNITEQYDDLVHDVEHRMSHAINATLI